MVLQTKSTVVFLLICCIITISCNSSNKNLPLVSVDIQEMPWMRTEDGYTLISDGSGFTRYRLQAKIWEMYSNEGDGYWYFPEKIYVEQFDSLFHVESSIKADTAYHFEKKELWHAIGNVVAKNAEGTTFETSELFWDEKVPVDDGNAFYTHKVVKITKADSTSVYGYEGFRADRSLTSIFIFSGKGDLIIEESADSLQQNTIYTDSIQLP